MLSKAVCARGLALVDLAGTERLKKVVILNPKGGSGKTTLAFGVAGYLACTGRTVALLDMDRQGSSHRWLGNRSAELPAIRFLSAPADAAGTISVPADIDVVVIDAPAALSAEELTDYTCGMHAILVPVLPSDIDIHAASQLVSDLLLKAQVSRRNGRLGIVANRVKQRTIAYRQLMRFLESLSIRLIGVLRDSQNYTRAAAEGRCLHEMTASQVSKDMAQWKAITEWLEDRLATPLTPRDWLRPATRRRPKRRLQRMLLPAAAVIGGLAIGTWHFAGTYKTPAGAASRLTDPPITLSSTPIQPIVSYRQTSTITPREHRPEALVPQATEPTATQVDEPAPRWRLAGVVQSGGARVLVLHDPSSDTTVNLNIDREFEGWSVADSGSNYAVLRRGSREIRLALNEEIAN
jgi:chromosome partitioning protein